jgi:putative transposase
VNLIKQSKLYQFAQSLPKTVKDAKTGKAKPNPQRTKAFAEAWQFYDFSDYAMQAYAGQIRQSWIGEHIDADTAQSWGLERFGRLVICCWAAPSECGSRVETKWIL